MVYGLVELVFCFVHFAENGPKVDPNCCTIDTEW